MKQKRGSCRTPPPEHFPRSCLFSLVFTLFTHLFSLLNEKKRRKVWWNEKKAVPLHPQMSNGTLADRLGNGLQNRVEQFDSARYLKAKTASSTQKRACGFLVSPPPLLTSVGGAGLYQFELRRISPALWTAHLYTHLLAVVN